MVLYAVPCVEDELKDNASTEKKEIKLDIDEAFSIVA
jgi:hypothetical protein